MHLGACRATEEDTTGEAMIDVAIRFDDPSAVSDHSLERALLRIMSKHHVSATFAVIPCMQQQTLHADSVPHLVEALQTGIVEIAQHGYSHERGSPGNGVPSEFAGIDRAEQRKKITAGRIVLERTFGTRIRGFVPPFNTFDKNTAATLSELGFLYLSAGSEHGLIETNRLAQLPRTCQVTELRRALSEARRRPGSNLVIVAVLHPYDFKEVGDRNAPLTLQDLSDLYAWLRLQPDVRLNMLGKLAARHDMETWRKAVWRNRWVQRQHWRIRALFPRYGLMPYSLFRYVRLAAGPT
jgi:predicted deacetylase